MNLTTSSASELSNVFTGKPQVEGLGYAFLFRNYRSEQVKWQTADPIEELGVRFSTKSQ